MRAVRHLLAIAFLAILPANIPYAQDTDLPLAPLKIAKPTSTQDAHKADIESLKLAAGALETLARANEALELAIIAWEAVDASSAWDGITRKAARETASEALATSQAMRHTASQIRNGPKEEKRTGVSAQLLRMSPEAEGYSRAGKLSKLLQDMASDAKALAMRSEGYMMKAQANAKEEYPELWERAAQEWSVTRTLFVAAEFEAKAASESFQKTRKMYYAGITQQTHDKNRVRPQADSSNNKQ